MRNDNTERDFAQGRAVGHAITIGRMKPQLREAVRLLCAVYSEFIDHTFVVAGPTPTDGSKDTQWMKDTERFLEGVSEFVEAQPDEEDLNQGNFDELCEHGISVESKCLECNTEYGEL